MAKYKQAPALTKLELSLLKIKVQRQKITSDWVSIEHFKKFKFRVLQF